MPDKLDPAAMEIPAPFVNQFQIVLVGGNLRISFAEGFAGEPSNYRSAVMMSSSDALALASSILNSLPLPPPNPAMAGLGALSALGSGGLAAAGQSFASGSSLLGGTSPKEPKAR